MPSPTPGRAASPADAIDLSSDSEDETSVSNDQSNETPTSGTGNGEGPAHSLQQSVIKSEPVEAKANVLTITSTEHDPPAVTCHSQNDSVENIGNSFPRTLMVKSPDTVEQTHLDSVNITNKESTESAGSHLNKDCAIDDSNRASAHPAHRCPKTQDLASLHTTDSPAISVDLQVSFTPDDHGTTAIAHHTSNKASDERVVDRAEQATESSTNNGLTDSTHNAHLNSATHGDINPVDQLLALPIEGIQPQRDQIHDTDQERAEPPQCPDLPELLGTDLQDIEGPDDMYDIDPLEALALYNKNKANFIDDGNDEDLGSHEYEPFNSDGQEQFQAEQDEEMIDWDTDLNKDETESNAKAAKSFSRLQQRYNRMKADGTATGEDDIQFIAAEAAEKKRLGDLERSHRVVEESVQASLPPGYEEQDSLFIPEVPDLPEPSRKKPRAAPKPRNRVNAQETRDAIAVGSAPSATRKRRAPAGGEKRPSKKRDTNRSSGKSGPKKASRPTLSNLNSLGRTNIVRDAEANANKPDMPKFSSKNKATALQQLIASIPSAENCSGHSSDKAALLEASKKFNGRGAVRSDGQGGWKLRNMVSSLYHHQLLGAAWLRDRENGSQRPFGGLVCDEMGFGKTIQMIANILDGKPQDGSPNKTTLIVAPPSLLNQWMLELDRHVQPGKLGRILRYHSGARLHSNDLLADLMQYDIILTTYSEIQRSYPTCEPPLHLTTEQRKNQWWEDFYREHVGPLHRIKYHRIVLDEAHHIKNHTSKTSLAVRALTGVFRWAITGTPILNYVEELFPYFSFLKVPHTGDYTTFVHNYCNNRLGKEPVNMSRIHNILRAIMLRRTHVDTMFNAPIVKLPGISHATHLVEFNEVERAIYNRVKSRFIHDINTIYNAGELNARYSNILAMISRLRMLCSHILLCQDTMKQLFNAGDVEALWRLTSKEVEPAAEHSRGSMIAALRKMIQSKSNTVKTCQSTEADLISATTPEFELKQEELNRGGDFGMYFKFRKFLRDLASSKAWTELHLRSTCGKCRLPPDDPMCTSCFHVYCQECLNAMEFERQAKKEEKLSCIECGAHFEETSPCTGLQELGFNSAEVATKIEKVKSKRKAPSRPGSNRRKSTSMSPESDDEEEDKDWIELGGTTLSSAKLTATKAAILNWRERCPKEKIIIYTQFLGLVRILGKVCSSEGWSHVKFTGEMSLAAREKAINTFADDEETFILICSLKAGGVGLNLNMASKVIILDLWFNSSIEAQAYCRAFRIGQQRKVEVVRFVVKDSIDEDLIRMQDRKDKEVTGAIGPDSHGKRATITQLLSLFGEVVEDGQNEFILVEDEAMNDDDPDIEVIDRLPPRPF